MDDDKLLAAQIADKIETAKEKYMAVSTGFLDPHQRKTVYDQIRAQGITEVSGEIRCLFYGGYDDAERCIAVFLPDYCNPEEELKGLLSTVRVRTPRGGRKLSHRDYLGSLLSLGIDRNVTGDILVRTGDDPGADIIVLSNIAEFIEMNYKKAGSNSLEAEIIPVEETDTGCVNIVKRSDTVASLRLDCIVASAFRISRAKASEAVKRGLVALNGAEETRTDTEVREKDKIVFRGRGKVILAETGGTSKKERRYVTYDEYR